MRLGHSLARSVIGDVLPERSFHCLDSSGLQMCWPSDRQNDRQIGRVPPVKLFANQGGWIGANGEASLRETVELGNPVKARSHTSESKDSVMDRSPTKKLAAFQFCARSSTWRPL